MLGEDVEVTTINSHKIADDDELHDTRVVAGTVQRRWRHTTAYRCSGCGIRLSRSQAERLEMLPATVPDDYWIHDDRLSFEEAAEAARLGQLYLESEGPGRERALAAFKDFIENTKGD